MQVFRRFEFWLRHGAYRPSHWIWGIDRSCSKKCIIIDLGFWTFTYNRSGTCSHFDGNPLDEKDHD